MSSVTLERRLANFRAAIRPDPPPSPAEQRQTTAQALHLAELIGAEVVGSGLEAVIRYEPMTVILPVDREALARLPGQPPADVPLVCLDTETTGLATAAGTMAFLVGLGWWEGDRFRQAQLILPDQPNEPAMLAMIEAHIPPSAWLVTYNGRGFDWPLLVTRYRMARRDAPVHAGHLDLLPFVRRVFRHRMADARLRSVETELLGVERHEDVEGWQIPGRYLDFLRIGLVEPLVEVIRHNREDVRSLARLLSHVEARFAAADALAEADPGDLAGLARAYAREGRLESALACLDAATGARGAPARTDDAQSADDGWWLPRRPVDFGGRPTRLATAFGPPRVDSPWTEDRVLVERARILRRLGRFADAAAVWEAIGAGAGPLSAHGWIEVAKLREHRLHDLPGAFVAAERARAVVERRRRLGRFDPALDEALAGRLARLGRRLRARQEAAVCPPEVATGAGP
jgi:RNase_H superfamily